MLNQPLIICPPEGSPTAKICLIGEAPGSREILNKPRPRPFVGPAGGILEQCLHAAGILRSECYLTNLFKFKVKKRTSGRNTLISDPQTDELLWHSANGFTEAAQPFLEELANELEETSCNVFVPLGGPALEALTGRKGVYNQRGSILNSISPFERGIQGLKCIPTIHPAATLQSGDYLARYYIIYDLSRIKEESQFPAIRLPEQDLIIQPSLEMIVRELADIRKQGLNGKRVCYDIEIMNQEVSAISFATTINRSISIPFDKRWTEEQELEIWEQVCSVLEDPKITKCNQNILFDNDALLFRNKIIVQGPLDDTMMAVNLMYPDFPKDLGFITSICTKVPYYKDEGKIWWKGLGTDIDQFYRYSAQDSAVVAESMDVLDQWLDKDDYRELYDKSMKIYPVTQAMMLRGILANKPRLLEVKAELEAKRDSMQEQLNLMCGRELNVKSTKQKIEYFYIEKNIPPYKKGGRPTTDEKAMVKLAKGTSTRPPIPEAQMVVDITKIRSMLEKYMEVELDPDGRLRCQINPRGTTTGRLSTGKRLITNSGLNMQNLSQEFKSFLVADPGYVLVELDKVQAEWVIVAFCSGDARMINVARDPSLDPHAITGSLITELEDIDLIRAEAKVLKHETNPDTIREVREREFPELIRWAEKGMYLPRHMTIRQLGKKSNHGGNYGMGYRRCAREWEIPEYEAKTILPRYHRAYPGVQNGFQAEIVRQLSDNRTVTNCFGRKRKFYNRVDWKNTNSKVFEQAFGFLPQSTVADLINRGMIKMYEDTQGPMGLIEMLMQIHDSVLFQFPINNTKYTPLAQAILTSCEYLNPTLKYGGREFMIQTEIQVGTCWGDMKEVDFDEDSRRLAKRLSEVL